MTNKIIILICFVSTTMLGQVDRIKIVKEKPCKFKVTISDKIINDTLWLGGYTCIGIDNAKSEDVFLQTYKTKRGSLTIMNQNNIEILFADFCLVDNYKLHHIKATPLKDFPNSYFLTFNYIKK